LYMKKAGRNRTVFNAAISEYMQKMKKGEWCCNFIPTFFKRRRTCFGNLIGFGNECPSRNVIARRVYGLWIIAKFSAPKQSSVMEIIPGRTDCHVAMGVILKQ
jgi:hypothetical protein